MQSFETNLLSVQKGERNCKYLNNATPTIEFVAEPGRVVTGPNTSDPPSSDTWKSVIEHQVDLVKKSNTKTDRPGAGVPF
jgi:hypothetical protein